MKEKSNELKFKGKDLTGQKFGHLTAKFRGENDKSGHTRWWCKCDCGNPELVLVTACHLKNGHTKSCGCKAQNKVHSLIGKVYGRLTVIKQDTDSKVVKWLCQCNCGNPNLISVTTGQLNDGRTQSCGCLQRELVSKRCKKYNTYDLSGEYGVGYTTKGEEFYFDLEDYDKIKNICWQKHPTGYIVATYNNKSYKMHRIVMECNDEKIIIDHIHGDNTRSDNRKSNLRFATPIQNGINKKKQSNNSSGYPGISWHKRDCVWQAYITVEKSRIYLGSFVDLNEAIKIRKEAEDKYFGEWSYDNSQKHNLNESSEELNE